MPEYTRNPLWKKSDRLNKRIQAMTIHLPEKNRTATILRNKGSELPDAVAVHTASESREDCLSALHRCYGITFDIESMLFMLLLFGYVTHEQSWRICRQLQDVKRQLIASAARLPKQ